MLIPYLQVDGLTKSFGDLVLFEGISFGVAQGQRVGLIARNGAGKSTLLDVLAGIEGHDSGSIVYKNDLRVGYLRQRPVYPAGLTVLEACFHETNDTLQLIREYEQCLETPGNPGLDDLLDRMEHADAWNYEQRAKQILTSLHITDYDQKVETLSGGQLKRVALANVLIGNPDMLILDEPTASLDALAEEEIFKQFSVLSEGKISIFISHRLSSAVTAGKIVVLDGGELIEMGNHDELMAKGGVYHELFSTQAKRYTGGSVRNKTDN